MQAVLRVVIADTHETFALELREALEQSGYAVPACTGDGAEALNLIRAHQADVLILDPVLTGMDGVALLRALKQEALRPAVLAVSGFASSYLLLQLRELGVSCFLMKPCSIESVLEHLGCVLGAGAALRSLLEPAVTDLLRELSIPVSLIGFHYLRYAVLLCAAHMELIGAVTKELYPAVAEEFHSTPGRVERDIRTAIAAGWEYGDPAVYRKYFGRAAAAEGKRPSNAAFIAALADDLRLPGRESRLG